MASHWLRVHIVHTSFEKFQAFFAISAWAALKLYKVGVFLTVSLTTTAILTILIGLLSGTFSGGVVVISVILGIAMGIAGVIFDKLIIILFTAISGGLCTGIALAAVMGQPVLGVVIGIQNLSTQPIVGFYFDIACYDLLKNELECVSNAAFLDLNVEQGKAWFSTKSICLPDKTTRKCILTIKNVVMKNEEIWKNESYAALQDLSAAEGLTLPTDLAEEYYTEIEENQKVRNAKGLYRFSPKQEQEYWCCSCGQINTNKECVSCKISKAFLFTVFDTSRLQQQRQGRIAEKLKLDEERRQHIVEQTEHGKQVVFSIYSQAKSKFKTMLLWLNEGCVNRRYFRS